MAAMSEKIISFDAEQRLLNKVRAYMSALDELICGGNEAVDLLLKAIGVADEDLKVKIVIMLGTMARPRVAWSLLDIMRDLAQSENVRQAAAIQISVMGGALEDKDVLVGQLLVDLQAEAPFLRANAAMALGWEGNTQAAPDLIDCLSDNDIEVQQAAVNALSNLHDDSLFAKLAQRLQKGGKEQQRSILYNLSHFPSRYGDAAQICRTYVHHNDPDLRYDALVVLHILSDANRESAINEHCLDDSDARIRELALMHLKATDRSRLKSIMPKVRRLVNDPQARVRQAATRLVHYVDSISLAGES
jgi:HEAT repeat protein